MRTEDGAEGDGVGASRTRYANGCEAPRCRDRAIVRSRRQAFHGPAAQDRSLPLAQGSGRPPPCRANTGLTAIAALDLVDPIAVHRFRAELQVKTLAYHSGQKAPHRVLLPTRGLHYRVDRGARRRSKHCNGMRLLGARLPLFGLALVLAL